MTVLGRLGAVFVVLGGAALLLVDGLRSPPGFWYAAASVVAGTTMVAYKVMSSSSRLQSQPAPEPTSTGKSEESTTALTTRQNDTQPADSAQTIESIESVEQDPEPAIEDDPDPPKPPISKVQLERPSTAMKRPQRLSTTTQTTQRTTSNRESSRTRKTTYTSTHRTQYVASTASGGGSRSTSTGSRYFTPVESSHEIKFAQVDTKVSFLDVDLGPEFIDIDPIPDLIEVDVGPSAVSQDLFHSPIEIKISSFLETLLAPTPSSPRTAVSDDNTGPSATTENQSSRRKHDTRPGRRPVPRETRYRERDRRVGRRRAPLTGADGREQPTGTRSQPYDRVPETPRHTLADSGVPRSWEDISASDGSRPDSRRFQACEPVEDEKLIGTQDEGSFEEPAVDMDLNYSPPRLDPPQWCADPIGLGDFDPELSEPNEPILEHVEQPQLGLGMSDWEPDVSIEEPVMEPGIDEEMFGLNGVAEPPEEGVGLPGFNADSKSNPLFPDSEGIFPQEDIEDDWLSF